MLILIHDSDLLKIFSLQWDSLLGFGTHLGHGNVRTGMAWIELVWSYIADTMISWRAESSPIFSLQTDGDSEDIS